MTTRERSVAAAIVVLAALLAVVAPSYFDPANVRDIFLANPVLLQGGFADRVAKWNVLKDAADKAGLSTDEAGIDQLTQL